MPLYDLIKIRLDVTLLARDMLHVDKDVKEVLPHKRDVEFLTLCGLTHNISITAEFHRRHSVIFAPGLWEFFVEIMGDSLKDENPYLYMGKANNVERVYMFVTAAEIADIEGIDVSLVDAFLMDQQISAGRMSIAKFLESRARKGARGNIASGKGPSGFSAASAGKRADANKRTDYNEQRAEVDANGGSDQRKGIAGESDDRKAAGGGESGREKAIGVVGADRQKVIDFERMAQDIIKAQLFSVPGDIVIPVDQESIEGMLKRLQAGQFDSRESAEVHRKALVLSTSPGFDRLISLDVVRNILPFPYQVGAVKEVLRRMRGRAILADEVGLGKTIEAGLVMMEYILRGLAKRVLILCPPPLMSQWMDEMRSKFNMDFVTSDDPSFLARKNPWLEVDRIIASIDTAKREPHSKLVQSAPFDLVIVDEAHRCRNKNTLNWKLVNGLKKKYILLLTATPVQNDLHELFNLITLLRPGQLETAADFSRRFITRGDKLKPRNVSELRGLMKEVMVRNRRETCGIQLPRRRAETVRVALSPQEAEFYSKVSQFVRAQYGAGLDGRANGKAVNRFTLKTLQKEAGSSAFAAVPTLRKMLDSGNFNGARRDLRLLIDIGEAIEDSAKARALLKLLRNTEEKVLVFTGYMATLEFLAQFLKKEGVQFATFSGEMPRLDKERAVEAFRGDKQVLLSTESGGEGRNLQFCHVMVNFDLPWNPMKIEQRIGRIHRIGQENDVFVFNLSAAETLEAHILDILDAKINMFELVIGELDMILGNVEEEEDFEDTIMDLWAGAKTEEELRQGFDSLGEKLAQAKARYEQTKEYDDKIFGSELSSAEQESKAEGKAVSG